MTTTSHWTEREVAAMGSTARVVVGGGDDSLVEWALDELAFLERTWSRFRPDSDLCRLNARPGQWVPVSPPLLLALELARELWVMTHGVFNPAVLRALQAAGYDTTFELVRSTDEPAVEPPPVADFRYVEIDEEASIVRVPLGTTLDLGGIGKGLAADLVAEGLVARGATSALVSLGGDIRVAGSAPEHGWPIPVEDPFSDGRTAFTHVLTSGAIVTSTTLLRTWVRAGRRLHHLIDPRTADPADSGVVAVVAAGRDAWLAEGLAKAAVILGPDRGAEVLRNAGVRAWLFLDDRTVLEVAP